VAWSVLKCTSDVTLQAKTQTEHQQISQKIQYGNQETHLELHSNTEHQQIAQKIPYGNQETHLELHSNTEHQQIAQKIPYGNQQTHFFIQTQNINRLLRKFHTATKRHTSSFKHRTSTDCSENSIRQPRDTLLHSNTEHQQIAQKIPYGYQETQFLIQT
jgi:hypothetical protein